MRIRYGFVSNSSSSSFILAIKNNIKYTCPTYGRCGIDFLDLVEKLHYNNDDNEVDSTDYEEIRAWLIENSEWIDGDINYILKSMKDLKRDGYDFAQISVSLHEDTLRNLMLTSKNIKILYQDE